MLEVVTEKVTKLLFLCPSSCAPGSNKLLSTWNQMSLSSREKRGYDSELSRSISLCRNQVNQFAESSLCDRLSCWLVFLGIFKNYLFLN